MLIAKAKITAFADYCKIIVAVCEPGVGSRVAKKSENILDCYKDLAIFKQCLHIIENYLI